MKHTLSKADQDRLIQYLKKKNAGFADKIQKVKLWTMRLNGFGAELAFCRLTNTKFDWETFDSIHDSGDTKWLGEIVDVKQTKYHTGDLLVNPEKIDGPAKIYVLMVGEFPTYEYRGYAYKQEVFQPENITRRHGYQTNFAVSQLNLRENPRKEDIRRILSRNSSP